MNHHMKGGDDVETILENDPDKLPQCCQISKPFSSGVVPCCVLPVVVMMASLFLRQE